MAHSKSVSSTATARLKQDYMRILRDPVNNFFLFQICKFIKFNFQKGSILHCCTSKLLPN